MMQSQEEQLLSVFVSGTFGIAFLSAFLGGVVISYFSTLLSGRFWNRYWQEESHRFIPLVLCFGILYALPGALYLHAHELLSIAGNMNDNEVSSQITWPDIEQADRAAKSRENRQIASPEDMMYELIRNSLPGIWQGVAPLPDQIKLSPELKNSLSSITLDVKIPPESPFYAELTRACMKERNSYLRRCFESSLKNLVAFSEWAFFILLAFHPIVCAREAYCAIRLIPLDNQFAEQKNKKMRSLL